MSVESDQAAIEAAENPEPEAPEAEAPEAEDTSGAAESELIFGKYKTIDEAEKGYKELEQRYHADNQKPEPEPEEEQYFDPYQALAPQLDEATAQRIANFVQQDPAQAMGWALNDQTQVEFGPNIADLVFAYWQQMPGQYLASQRWLTSYETQALRDEIYQNEIEPIKARHNEQLAEVVEHRLIEGLPDFDTYRDRISEYLSAYPIPDNDPRAQSPEAMEEYVKGVYLMFRGQDWLAELQQQAEQAAEEEKPASKRARTSTRSTASKPAPVEQDLADFYADFGVDVTTG